MIFSEPLNGKVCQPKQEILEKTNQTNVLVAITAHFVPDRLEYLSKVLLSLASLPRAEIIIITNTSCEEDLELIKESYKGIVEKKDENWNVSIQSYEHLDHPFDLTWCHKDYIQDFVSKDNKYTHFVYLEDDITFDFTNLCYFIEFREALRPQGLIPSFLRVEYREITQELVNTDNFSPTNIWNQPYIRIGSILFVNLANPYAACFVFDKELAQEYVHSTSFDKEKSAFSGWGVRECAAQGLCFENIPVGFSSRYVVPVSLPDIKTLECSWIYHLPNNYANNENTDFGKVPMDLFFYEISGSKDSE